MSGGDVYEVRMRVKSGPKSGAIGNSSFRCVCVLFIYLRERRSRDIVALFVTSLFLSLLKFLRGCPQG